MDSLQLRLTAFSALGPLSWIHFASERGSRAYGRKTSEWPNLFKNCSIRCRFARFGLPRSSSRSLTTASSWLSLGASLAASTSTRENTSHGRPHCRTLNPDQCVLCPAGNIFLFRRYSEDRLSHTLLALRQPPKLRTRCKWHGKEGTELCTNHLVPLVISLQLQYCHAIPGRHGVIYDSTQRLSRCSVARLDRESVDDGGVE